MNVATLDVAAILDVNGIKSGAEEGKRALSGLVDGFGSLAKTALSPLGMITDGLGSMVRGLGTVGFAITGLKAVGSTFAGMVSGLTAGNAALEMTTISFKTLLGSGQAADAMIKQLTTFAESTPFELAGLESSTQNLLAFGFQAKDIIPLMTSMGDAISALGGTQANLDSLVHVMGQMRQEAHINAGDIMQMTNLGIPALQMLANHYHVTTGAMQEMVSKGLVPGSDAIKIFSDGMEKQYGGMMAAQSATFSGMISNLQDWASATTITLTKPLFAPAKQGLQDLLNFVQSPAGVAAINTLAGYIQTGVNDITRLFKEGVTPVKVFLSAFQGKEVDGIKGFDTTAGQLATTLGMVANKAIELFKTFSPLVTIFDVFKGFLTGGIEGGLFALEQRITGMGKAFGVDLAPAMQGFDTFVGDTLIPTIKNIVAWIETSFIPAAITIGKTLIDVVIPNIINFATSVYNFVKPAVEAIVKFILENLIPAIKSMAEWFELHIVPIIQALAKTFMQDILPALGRFWDFATKNIFPALGDLFDWISEKIIPVIGKLVAFILDTVIPVLVNWWEILATVLKPIIEWLADFIVNTLIPAMTNIGKFLISDVFPVLKNLVNIFVNDVLPVLGKVVDFVSHVFGFEFNVLINIVKGLVSIFVDVLLPALGNVWNFIAQNILPIFTTLGNIIGTVVGGAIGGLMWAVNNIILPGFNLMVSVIGNIINFIKTAVRTVANFFIDVINTPLNLINTLIDALKNAPVIGGAFGWLGHIPTLGYLSFAQGTPPGGAPGGPAMVGDNPYGPEIVTTGGQQYLVSAPTLTMLNKGDTVTPVAGGKGGGNTYQITIPLTIYGNPDDLAIAQFEDMATRIVNNALENTGAGVSSRKGFAGAQR